MAVAVLVVLFVVQRHGTGAVGKMFGPVIVLWFAVLAVTGIGHIVQEPRILAALNRPRRSASARAGLASVRRGRRDRARDHRRRGAVRRHGALRKARSAWRGSASCCRAPLNYMGQGALLMHEPGGDREPVLPHVPAIGADPGSGARDACRRHRLASVISGAFSMTRQAVQLGFLPRMRVL
jgi:KUP system potassium uptake protein